MITTRVVAASLLLLVTSCDAGDRLNLTPDLGAIPTGMADRTSEVDLTAVTNSLRVNGGTVFVLLTCPPTATAIEVLGLAGLTPPPGRDRIVTFPLLVRSAVWGSIPPNGIARIGALRFVVRIEPSADADGFEHH